MSATFLKRCCITLVTLTAVLQLHSRNIWAMAKETNPICNTPECRKLGKMYKKSMNEDGKPCTDFYDYVCRNWGLSNPKPKNSKFWDLGGTMEDRAETTLKILLVDRTASGIPTFEQAKRLYQACMKTPYMERTESPAMKSLMAKIGKWPTFFSAHRELPSDFPWWQIDLQYLRISGQSAFFHISLVADLSDNRNLITIRLGPIYSPYGMLIRLRDWRSNLSERIHYMSFLKEVINSVAPIDPKSFGRTIDNDLEDIMKFRENLDALIKKKNAYKLKTLESFQEWYYEAIKNRVNDKINWLEVIRAFYRDKADSHHSKINLGMVISVDQSYFEKLILLINETPTRVIVNHIHLYFAERHIKLTPTMEAELKKSIQYDVDLIGHIRYSFSRDSNCLANHNMLVTLARMYMHAKFPDTSKTAVKKLVEETKLLFQEQFMESTWLTRETKELTAHKLDSTKMVIGYPDWYLTANTNLDRLYHEIDKHDLEEIYPAQPDAYYSYGTNGLYMSAALLQWPIYSPNVPYVIDSATTIVSIGHELYHAVDSEGIHYNKYGLGPWWPNLMVSSHKKKSECFVVQYEKHRKREMLNYNFPGPAESYLAPQTTREDISDAMGLKLGYRRFMKKFNETQMKCPVLPGFENYGCEKLFFIAFGNLLCSNYSIEDEKELLLIEEHSASQVRLNGAVANMKEFSKAFGCRCNDPLNLRKRCDIWK